jgi:hypothetical protein
MLRKYRLDTKNARLTELRTDSNDVRAVIKENGFNDDDKTMVTNGG